MSNATPSLEQLKRALQLAEQIQSLEAELATLLGSPSAVRSAAPAPASKPSKRGGKRIVSAEARAKMAAAQKARWAKVNRAKSAAGSAPAPAAKSAKKKKRGITPEGRARLAAAMKARWAARRKAQ
jgi:hypothetical protein